MSVVDIAFQCRAAIVIAFRIVAGFKCSIGKSNGVIQLFGVVNHMFHTNFFGIVLDLDGTAAVAAVAGFSVVVQLYLTQAIGTLQTLNSHNEDPPFVFFYTFIIIYRVGACQSLSNSEIRKNYTVRGKTADFGSFKKNISQSITEDIHFVLDLTNQSRYNA